MVDVSQSICGIMELRAVASFKADPLARCFTMAKEPLASRDFANTFHGILSLAPLSPFFHNENAGLTISYASS